MPCIRTIPNIIKPTIRLVYDIKKELSYKTTDSPLSLEDKG
ncbi:hypothetical protein M5D96_008527 [Drosophila gunungcola]|uniref:Uncharacterized protein n=1 Tax=Drosophila gunungcola TaxID=103775 RepID=A0A9P9YKE5_9MUSC|nr:hypothetical protein M5D96_008527 [Drosophila gunungcola]